MDAVTLLQSLVSGVLVGGIYTVAAVGLDVTFGCLDLVNMAHGEFLMLTMYFSFFLYTFYNVGLSGLIIVVPVVFVILSLPIFLGLYKIMIGKPHSTQILYTAALSIVIQNVMLLLFSSEPRTLFNPYRVESLSLGPILLNKALLIAFIFSVIVVTLSFLFLYKTDRGTLIRAAINKREVIPLLGLDPYGVYIQTFCLGLTLTAVGGLLLAFYYPVSPFVGHVYTVFMWVAIVLGGTGSIKGSLVGGLTIGISQILSAVLLEAHLQNIFILCIFVIVVVFKPQGLFRR